MKKSTATATTHNVRVFGPNLNAPETFHVHTATCKDCRKYGRGPLGGDPGTDFVMSATCEDDVIACVYADIIAEREGRTEEEEVDSLRSEFKFFDCCGLPEKALKTEVVVPPKAVPAKAVPAKAVPAKAVPAKPMTFEDACNFMCDFNATEEQVAQASAILNGCP